MLSTAQLQTLKSAILADPVLSAYPPGSTYAQTIANALNQPASPNYVVWRTSITRDEIQNDDAFNWTQVDNLNTGTKYRIWEWMFDNPTRTINPSKANVQAGISACWTGNVQLVAVATMVLGKCKRSATAFEKLYASGSGTTVSPSLLLLESPVSADDVQTARELP